MDMSLSINATGVVIRFFGINGKWHQDSDLQESPQEKVIKGKIGKMPTRYIRE